MADEGRARPVLRWGAATAVGHVRDHNEDAFHADEHVCVVADGMGGHAAGEVASAIVTTLAAQLFARRPVTAADVGGVVAELDGAVVRASAESGHRGMGTTIVGVAVVDPDVDGGIPAISDVRADEVVAVVFHVGDSRCYELADGQLRRLTTDHSHVQELVDAGMIEPADAAVHPLRNVVTRALGADVSAVPDVVPVPSGDHRLLLCSDGLSGELTESTIRDVLLAEADPQVAVDALVAEVLDGAARDNVTAVVVDIVASSSNLGVDEPAHRRPTPVPDGGGARLPSAGELEWAADWPAPGGEAAPIPAPGMAPLAPSGGASWSVQPPDRSREYR